MLTGGDSFIHENVLLVCPPVRCIDRLALGYGWHRNKISCRSFLAEENIRETVYRAAPLCVTDQPASEQQRVKSSLNQQFDGIKIHHPPTLQMNLIRKWIAANLTETSISTL